MRRAMLRKDQVLLLIDPKHKTTLQEGQAQQLIIVHNSKPNMELIRTFRLARIRLNTPIIT